MVDTIKGVSFLRVGGNNQYKYFRVQLRRTVIFDDLKTARVWYDIISRAIHGPKAKNNGTEIPEKMQKLALLSWERLLSKEIPLEQFRNEIATYIEVFNI